MRCPSSQIIILRLCYSPYFALLAKFVVINYTITERPSDFFSYLFIPRNKKVVFSNYLFVSFSLYSVFNELLTATLSPGGDDRDRTDYLLNAIQALSQVSYAPVM